MPLIFSLSDLSCGFARAAFGRLWGLRAPRADLAMVLLKLRTAGGLGLPDSAVTPFDTSLESRKVWRTLLAADDAHSATSPPVFTAGLVGLIRLDAFLNVTGTMQLHRNPGSC